MEVKVSQVPTIRQRFKAAISSATNLEIAAGLCAAVHKAELRELFEELEAAFDSGGNGNVTLVQLKHEYCD